MADNNNFDKIRDSFEYITNALDSMRAQNAMSSGNLDKVLNNITAQLEVLTGEETSDLMKVFMAELKRSLDERHVFVSSQFSELENSFKEIVKKSEKYMNKEEMREILRYGLPVRSGT